ncbi:exopolysaccharide biosynthesis protein [Sulfitobacter sp. HNIBRBA3233]|uniref:exopolysaccharide biosynthesis protein n=1 Tax=Sulfitobacter marinivivus TaxID=3158558 RepID=UPI0032DEFA1B
MENDISSAGDVVDALDDLAQSEDDVTIGDVVDSFGGRGFGPIITLLALVVISPLGGIPVLPTLVAIVIALIAVQLVIGRDALWLPRVLSDRGVDDRRVEKAAEKLRRPAGWLDRRMGARAAALVAPPMPRIAAGVVIVLCLAVPPSEVIPFAALLPMGAIALIGMALTVRDGLAMVVALAASAAAFYGLWLLA